VVFAAVAVEVLPDVVHRNAPLSAGLVFSLGAVAMLVMRAVVTRFGGEKGGRSTTLVVTVAIDIAIDGLLLGLGFALGQTAGMLLAIALGCEFLARGLATSAQLIKGGMSRLKAIATMVGLAIVPFSTAWAGFGLLSGLSAGLLVGFLAFAAAVFLWLVTEELLVEAHEVPEMPWATSLFFVGFLLLLLIDMLTART
jgi:zinc transporter, ZIP family